MRDKPIQTAYEADEDGVHFYILEQCIPGCPDFDIDSSPDEQWHVLSHTVYEPETARDLAFKMTTKSFEVEDIRRGKNIGGGS